MHGTSQLTGWPGFVAGTDPPPHLHTHYTSPVCVVCFVLSCFHETWTSVRYVCTSNAVLDLAVLPGITMWAGDLPETAPVPVSSDTEFETAAGSCRKDGVVCVCVVLRLLRPAQTLAAPGGSVAGSLIATCLQPWSLCFPRSGREGGAPARLGGSPCDTPRDSLSGCN